MVAGEYKLYGKQWEVRKSTLIYAHSRKPAKEITVQMLSGNVKRTLKQIVKDLVVDLSKSPSRAFQVWKMKERGRSYKMQGLQSSRSTLLLVCAQHSWTHCRHDIKTLCPQVVELCRNLGAPFKNDLCGVERASALTGEKLPGVQSSSLACTTMSSKWQQTLGLYLQK